VLPRELVPVFRQAKQLTDRHAPLWDQRALASLIDSGANERHVRRLRRENDQRRTALIDAIAQHLPPDARVVGAAAGLHLVLCLPSLRQQDEPKVAAAARERGVGVYPLSPLFAKPPPRHEPWPASFILGYASLTVEQIRQGMRILAEVLASLPRGELSLNPSPPGRWPRRSEPGR
jgi:GntR family transcriptional regulator/MocR family aminotransferase